MTTSEKKLVRILQRIIHSGYMSMGDGDTYAEVDPALLKKAEKIIASTKKEKP